MKTRTLLLLSVGTALMILVAGGVLLFQLSGQDPASVPTPLGQATTVGDAEVTVVDAELVDAALLVTLDIGGVDDPDGIDSFRLVTGDRQLAPTGGSGDTAERCAGITESVRRCAVEFDVAEAEGTSRVLILRRGEDRATWRLDEPGAASPSDPATS